MLFIVGTGRCGTHMVRDALNLHPDVYIPQETHWWPLLFSEYGLTRQRVDRFRTVMEGCRYGYGRPMIEHLAVQAGMEPDEIFIRTVSELGSDVASLCDFAPAFYRVLAKSQNAHLVGDKTPEYGASMATLALIWPHAKFLHVVRDGRSVARSMARHEDFRMMAKHGVVNWPLVAFSPGREHPLPAERGRTLKKIRGIPLERDFRISSFEELWALRLGRIRDEMQRVPATRVLELKYEEILESPQTHFAKIAAFAGIRHDEAWAEELPSIIRPSSPGRNHAASDETVQELLECYQYA